MITPLAQIFSPRHLAEVESALKERRQRIRQQITAMEAQPHKFEPQQRDILQLIYTTFLQNIHELLN